MKAFSVSAEEELLRARYAKKDPSAVKDFVEIYGAHLYGFLRSALGDRANLAHGLLTDSLAHYLRSIGLMLHTEPIRITLMRNFLKNLQKLLRDKSVEAVYEGKDPRLSTLSVCLYQLAWEERVLFLLRDQMDYSLEEMEAVLSKPSNEIRAQIKEARLHFREYLQKALKSKGQRI